MTISLAVCAAVILVIGATIAAIIYTPAGLLIPMSEEQLRQRYGAELFEVQQRLNSVSSEVLVLRDYNNKLRKALGQPEISSDSVFSIVTAEQAADALPAASPAEAPAEVPVRQTPAAVYRTAAATEEVSFRAAFPIITPAVGYISQRFTPENGHLGIDYSGKIGSLVVAAADGYTVFAGYTTDDGFTVILSHGGGYLTMYKHNQSVLTTVGAMVKRGEPIALLGNSGRVSYGPHLHFELWKDGKAQNPNEYIIASEL
ncbi:MAG: M23 family metallopeptidase [Bacteroidetes bacterium]|nr:MAG: M23 family metallopeptidase [Bacteroidota bacterium]